MKKLILLIFIFSFSCSKRKIITESENVDYLFSGTIVDCDDVPIVGATFILNGDSTQAQSNENGIWELAVNNVTPCENDICRLNISYIKDGGVANVSRNVYLSNAEIGEDNLITVSNIDLDYQIGSGLTTCPDTAPEPPSGE